VAATVAGSTVRVVVTPSVASAVEVVPQKEVVTTAASTTAAVPVLTVTTRVAPVASTKRRLVDTVIVMLDS
jgi:hypothetical protein